MYIHTWKEAKAATVTYLGPNAPGDGRSEELLGSLGDKLWEQFSCLDLPRLGLRDLYLLDKAISLLNPQNARVRVVEVDTFTVRGGSCVICAYSPQGCELFGPQATA